MLKNLTFVFRNKPSIFLLVLALIVGGVGAQATGLLNTSSGGYLVCVNSTTKVVTHPGTSSCAKGSKRLILGAQGVAGTNGLSGAAGLSGKDGAAGKDGKTLWNGVKDPESIWGAPGDMFINSVTKTLFGPKDLTTGWPAGVSMVGPAGAIGLTGLTGLTGQGGSNGGSGPAGAAGPTGAAGAAGPTGAAGAAGAPGQGPLYLSTTSAVILNNPDGINVIAMSLLLGPGDYLLHYTAQIFNLTGANFVDCAIDGFADYGNSIQVDTGIFDGREYFSFQKTLHLESERTVPVNCARFGSGEVHIYNSIFTALKVSSIDDQTPMP
jgi:hypothetical protein